MSVCAECYGLCFLPGSKGRCEICGHDDTWSEGVKLCNKCSIYWKKCEICRGDLKVYGTRAQLQAALSSLGGSTAPITSKRDYQTIEKVLKEAEVQHQYTPY
jgi:hypothetical protein